MCNRIQNIFHPCVFNKRATELSTSNKRDNLVEEETQIVSDNIDDNNADVSQEIINVTDNDLSETRIDLVFPRYKLYTLQEYLDEPNNVNQPEMK